MQKGTTSCGIVLYNNCVMAPTTTTHTEVLKMIEGRSLTCAACVTLAHIAGTNQLGDYSFMAVYALEQLAAMYTPEQLQALLEAVNTDEVMEAYRLGGADRSGPAALVLAKLEAAERCGWCGHGSRMDRGTVRLFDAGSFHSGCHEAHEACEARKGRYPGRIRGR